MGIFNIKSGNDQFVMNVDHVKVNDRGYLEVIEDHQLIAAFKEWDYFYEREEEEEN